MRRSDFLEIWGKALEEAIPEATGSLIVLPRVALKAAKATKASNAERVNAAEVLARMRRSNESRATPHIGAASEDQALRSELIDAFLISARRIRDFRADNLARVQRGDASGVFSDCSTADGQLACVPEDGKCLEFGPATNVGAPKNGWVIPCSGGWVIRLERECR